MDLFAWYFKLVHYNWWYNNCCTFFKMTKREALATLNRIARDPSLADQFTEEEIEQLEEIVSKK